MNAQTKKITTPITKVEIEIKEWITGADAEYISEAILEGVKIKTEKNTANLDKFNMSALAEQTHREIEKFVVSVNGVKENILKTVMELPESDYEFVKEAIAKIREEDTKKKEPTE